MIAGFLGGSVVKEPSICKAGDMGLIPGGQDPLEREMVTHFSILAWEIPGTGEPGGLPSMGSHRVGDRKSTRLNSSHIL